MKSTMELRKEGLAPDSGKLNSCNIQEILKLERIAEKKLIMKKMMKMLIIALLVIFGSGIPVLGRENINEQTVASFDPSKMVETELTREEYITQVAMSKGIGYEEAEAIIDQNESKMSNNLAVQPFSYQKHYSRFSYSFDYTNPNQSISESSSKAITCGVFATYYIDSANWQLRYFSSVDEPFVQYGYSIDEMIVFYKTAAITNSTTITYNASMRYSGGHVTDYDVQKTYLFSI